MTPADVEAAVRRVLEEREEPRLYDYATAAELLSCSRKTLERAVYRGEIDHFRDGNRVRFTAAHLRQYIERHERRAVSVMREGA